MKRNEVAFNLSDEDVSLLSQYLDGELPAADSRVLETRLHAEEPLRAALLCMQELNQRLRDALAERDTVPESISALLNEQVEEASERTAGATIVNFPKRAAPPQAQRRPRWTYALAASFVGAVALVLVNGADQSPDSGLPGNDALVSATLDRMESGDEWTALKDGREMRSVLTFPHEDGRWCREYLLRGGSSDWRAVACREEGRWVTQAAGLESYLEPSNAYRTAGAADAEPVAGFISQHAADIALDLDAEQRLIESGWR